jgi:hypothetical protein
MATLPCHNGRMGTIAKLHDKARRAIAAGEGSFRHAAEYLAEARKQGATQRQSAKAIGKSPAWVNRLLKWRSGGYRETPFAPQSKAKRAAVQSPIFNDLVIRNVIGFRYSSI